MAKLLKLRVNDFKSYNGLVEIELGQNYFTSIVGPNGSGKSNLMDAISFVLGMGMNDLRCSDWSDVAHRKDTRGPSTGGSYSVFVEAVYEPAAGPQIVFRRALVDGTCLYEVDGKSLTQKEYLEKLRNENILTDTRNFLVFQGDVEAVAARTPRELAHFLENVSGSIAYKEECEQLEEELRSSKQRAGVVNDRRKTLVEDVRQYRAQENARTMLGSMKERLTTLKKARVQIQSSMFNDRLDGLSDELNETKERLREAKKEYSDAKSKSRESFSSFGEERLLTLDIQRKEHEAARHVNELQLELVRIQKELENTRNEQRLLAPQIEYAQCQTKAFEEDLESRSRAVKIVERAQAKFEEEIEKKGLMMNLLSDELRALYDELKMQYEVETAPEQKKLDELNREVRRKQEAVNEVVAEVDALKQKREELSRAVSLQESKIAETKSSIEEYKSQQKTKREALQTLEDSTRVLKEKEQDLRRKLETSATKFKECGLGRRELLRRNKFLDTVAKVKRLFPGVIDVVAHLVSPREQKYQRALDRVLGHHFDTVIVDTFATAQSCIELLRRENLGRLTFLPLDGIKPTIIDNNLRFAHPAARLAIDTLSCNDRVRDAVLFICGNTLVCDTTDVASELRWKRKIGVRLVSIDGSVISTNNTMTGGLCANADRYDDRRIALLGKQIESMAEEVKTMRARQVYMAEEESVLLSEVDRINQMLELRAKSLSTEEQKLDSFQRNYEFTVREIEKYKSKVEAAEAEFENSRKDMEKLRTEVLKRRAVVFEPLTKQVDVDLDVYEKSQGEMLERKTELAKQHARVSEEEQIALDKMHDARERLEQLQQRLARYSERIDELEQNELFASEHLEDATTERDSYAAELAEAKATSEQVSDDLRAAKEELGMLRDKVTEISNDVERIETEISSVQLQKDNMLRDALLAGVSVPEDTEMAEGAQLENESSSGSNSELDEDYDDTRGDSQLKPNYRRARKRRFDTLLEKDDLDEPARLAKINVEIGKLEDEISGFTINPRAGEYLLEAQRKLEEVNAELKDKRQETEQLLKKFNRVKALRREKFMDALESVRGCIGDIYRELTATPVAPMGGSANFVALNEDEPYNDGLAYTVMPPRKRFCYVEQLSGGEKSMAALALLFAVHRYKPSPFFVLDEIDAALDYANVALISKYIKSHAGPGYQFIVISLKLSLFENSDHLVGVYRDRAIQGSRVLTINL